MLGNKKPVYYWDTCIFFAWLKNESLPPDVMGGIEHILKENKDEKNIIITSTLMITELLEGKINNQAESIFQDCLKRPNIITISPDLPIAFEARRLRDHYYRNNGPGKTLSSPDSIHLATAIIIDAVEFHTLDKSNKGTLGLLPLSGNVAGVNLTVCKPQAPAPTAPTPETDKHQGVLKYDSYREDKYEDGWLISGRSGGAIFVG